MSTTCDSVANSPPDERKEFVRRGKTHLERNDFVDVFTKPRKIHPFLKIWNNCNNWGLKIGQLTPIVYSLHRGICIWWYLNHPPVFPLFHMAVGRNQQGIFLGDGSHPKVVFFYRLTLDLHEGTSAGFSQRFLDLPRSTEKKQKAENCQARKTIENQEKYYKKAKKHQESPRPKGAKTQQIRGSARFS